MPRAMYQPSALMYPVPDEEGIAGIQKYFREKLGREMPDEQAADLLGRVMWYLYLISDRWADADATEAYPQEDARPSEIPGD